MNELKIFENSEFGRIRTILRDNEPWFVAADVCKALEIKNNRDALAKLDSDEKGVALTDTLGGAQEMAIINEPGLYALVLGSRKPEARAFKRWITHEVIPSIRRHGAYATADTIDRIISDPDFGIKLLDSLKRERTARIEAETQKQVLEAKAAQNAPKVLFADSVSASERSILVGEMAKLIKQNGVDMGQNRLFRTLREKGFLGVKGEYYNMPTQRSMEMGLFEIKEQVVNNPDGSVRLTRTPKVTGKGQIYFINLFANHTAG